MPELFFLFIKINIFNTINFNWPNFTVFNKTKNEESTQTCISTKIRVIRNNVRVKKQKKKPLKIIILIYFSSPQNDGKISDCA